MNLVLKENFVFFILLTLFALTGGVVLCNYSPLDLIFFFSHHRTNWLDLFFRYTTKAGEAYPYLILILVFLFIKYRISIYIAYTGLVVTLFSQTFKEIFAQERPALILKKIGLLDSIQLVQGVDLNLGLTSFPSGHTMSAFALYGFLALVSPDKKLGGILFFTTALLVGISRIYLVQHFPLDVYFGGLMGTGIGILMYMIQKKYPATPHAWMDKSLPVIGLEKLTLMEGSRD